MSRSFEKALNPKAWWIVALALGVLFRLLWVWDMEYKYDENWMFERAIKVGQEGWQWLGMVSGQGGVKNPGLSVWIFIVLSKLFFVETPPELCRAVIILNCTALIGLAVFAYRVVTRSERETWIWASALVALNPFAVLYERKIWAQSVMPLFCLLFVIGWWRRDRRWGAFLWGLVGACLGQIHMPGFFYAAAFVAWVLIWKRENIEWKAWFAGSVFGALPLIPWVFYLLKNGSGDAYRASTFAFSSYWLTDTWGIGLGYVLGLSKGQGYFEQLREFLSYPHIDGVSTYLVGATHAVMLTAGVTIVGRSGLFLIHELRTRQRNWKQVLGGTESQTAFAQQSALIGYGTLITATRFRLFRHYLLVTYPFEFVWLARQALRPGVKLGRVLLVTMLICHAFITASFLGFIHVNGGAMKGDYGKSYRAYFGSNPQSIFE